MKHFGLRPKQPALLLKNQKQTNKQTSFFPYSQRAEQPPTGLCEYRVANVTRAKTAQAAGRL